MENYLGRLLDNRYEILEVIGTGGMAVVYKALDHRLNRLVAVKILKDEFSRNQEFRRRFHAESQAVAMLSHPNIVSVYDVSRSGDVDYIVMELIEGITLKQYLEKKGCLNWRETLHFAMQIAKALEHAHSRGIVHRDIAQYHDPEGRQHQGRRLRHRAHRLGTEHADARGAWLRALYLAGAGQGRVGGRPVRSLFPRRRHV